LPTFWFRLNGIYGPHEGRHMPRVIKAARAGLASIAGFASQTRQDLVHLDNAVQAHAKAVKVLMNEPERCSGRAYFITDNCPVNTGNFFLNRVLPALDARRPSFDAPFWLMLALGWLLWFLSRVLGKRFGVPAGLMTVTEVYKSGKTHTFSVARAAQDIDYRPFNRADDEESWKAILASYGLK